MKALLFGGSGQLGTALIPILSDRFELMAPKRRSVNPWGNLSDPEKIAETIHSVKPQIVINAAAFTNVDQAETDPAIAALVNRDSVKAMAGVCREIDSVFIHFSTDYVFSGAGHKPWTENDPASPINCYGNTKLQGENAIRESGVRRAAIIRTSWLCGRGGKNFLHSILHAASQGKDLSVIDNEIGIPTSAEFLARVSFLILEKLLNTTENAVLTFHAVPDGKPVSRFQFAQWIVDEAARLRPELSFKKSRIILVSSLIPPRPARRPRNSVLDNHLVKQFLGIGELPVWQTVLRPVLEFQVTQLGSSDR